MTNTKKLLGAAAFSLVLAGGGMTGALLGSPVTSGAQGAEETETTDETTEATAHRPGRHGRHLAAAAETLGITEDELKTALQGGQTIAEVAEANSVDVDTVIDAMVAAATADIRERITAVVNGEVPAHRAHRGHHRGDVEPTPTSGEA